jgi:hypothetical protein
MYQEIFVRVRQALACRCVLRDNTRVAAETSTG